VDFLTVESFHFQFCLHARFCWITTSVILLWWLDSYTIWTPSYQIFTL